MKEGDDVVVEVDGRAFSVKAGDSLVFDCVDGRFVGRVVERISTGLLTVVSDGSTYSTYPENVKRLLSEEDKRRIRAAFEAVHRSAENEDAQPKEFAEAMATLLGFVRDEVPRLFFSSAAWNELPFLLSSEKAFRAVLEAGYQLLQLKLLFDERKGEGGPVLLQGGTPTPSVGGAVQIQTPVEGSAFVHVPPTHDALPSGTKAKMIDLLVKSHHHEEIRQPRPRPRPRPKLVVKKKPEARCQECKAPVSPEFAVCSRCYERRQGRKPMEAVEDGWLGSRRA